MKKIVFFTLFATALFIFSGCQYQRETKSEVLHELAVVVNLVYTPPTHETTIEPTLMGGKGLGIGVSGEVGLGIGHGLQITSVDVPPEYAVVFRCQHGKFIVRHKEVYDELLTHEGDTVEVAYQEVYREVFETRDGRDTVLSRTLTKYDFLDAVPKSQ